MVDYHLHTSRCCHATGTLEEYLAAAEEKELHEIGFADHYPLGLLGCKPRSQVTMHPEELPEYIMQVEKLRAASKTVRVKLGIEVDFLPGTENKRAACFRLKNLIT
jgi:histidinol-phosphatase (PHP family)